MPTNTDGPRGGTRGSPNAERWQRKTDRKMRERNHDDARRPKEGALTTEERERRRQAVRNAQPKISN